jgi:hypothetical protein
MTAFVGPNQTGPLPFFQDRAGRQQPREIFGDTGSH